MTRYEANIEVDGRTIWHICKQPNVEAVKAKIKRAYPGKQIEFGTIEPAHSHVPAEPLAQAA